MRILKASDGMLLTNGETYTKEVILGIDEDEGNWCEIDEKEVVQ